MNDSTARAYLLTPMPARIVEKVQESETVFTVQLVLENKDAAAAYRFQPGQFNMVSLFGVGEVAISISSDPAESRVLGHTIRTVGRVTRGFAALDIGDQVGLRGPFGRGWPLAEAQGSDIVIITGGLGCAPVRGVIDYVARRRQRYGKLVIIQGVKHSKDLIYRDRFAEWAELPDTQTLIAANSSSGFWPWHVGPLDDVFDSAEFNARRCVAMMCGPEGMMIAATKWLDRRGVLPGAIYLSMERNMQCGHGMCGHCQFGGRFVCRDGPVFSFDEVRPLFGRKGF
jgi:NAD(P)H-flavin reductase